MIVCHGAPKSFPVAQMITQSHSMDSIESWLKDWLNNNQQPGEIITDESSALMGAAVKVFTQFRSINEYLDAVMKCLQLGSELPRCFMRNDRAHFVGSVHRNVKKGLQQTVRIIRGVLGYLITCTSLKEAEYIISKLFTLICNEYNSVDVDNAYKALLSLVRTHEINEDGVKIDDDATNNVQNLEEAQKLPKDNSYKATSNYIWVQDILKAIPINDQGLDESDEKSYNAFYAPKYVKYLTRTFVRMPLWSNLMVSKFKSKNICATSSTVESAFKDIQRNLCSTKRRVDVFTERHLKNLAGQLKLILANQKVSTSKRSKRKASFDDSFSKHCDYIGPKRLKRSLSTDDIDKSNDSLDEHFENWRNRGKPVLITKNVKKLRRCAQSILTKTDLTYFGKWPNNKKYCHNQHLCIRLHIRHFWHCCYRLRMQ